MELTNGIEPQVPHPEFPHAAAVGLVWTTQQDNVWWKSQQRFDKYTAIRAICITGIPPVPDPPPPVHTYQVTWSGVPGDVMQGNGVTHDPELCRVFYLQDGQTGFSRVTADVKVYSDGELYWHKKFYVDIAVIGGPLEITVPQRAHVEAYADRHLGEHLDYAHHAGRSWAEWVYPRYAVDFDYDPFAYRHLFEFKPNSLHQRVNVFAAEPVWPQPPGTRIWYGLGPPGVFVNYQVNGVEALNSFDVPGGGPGPNPHLTKGLPKPVPALVASRPVGPGSDEFQLGALYGWYPGFRHSDPGDPIDGPAPGGTPDDSNKYYGWWDDIAGQ